MGEAVRAREWIDRTMLINPDNINPDNINQRYNLVCCLMANLNDDDGALDFLEPYLEQATRTQIEHIGIDPDMNRIRNNPRFRAMVAAARARLEMADGPETVGGMDA